MDKWQHELESSIHWDQGDILIVDVGVVSFQSPNYNKADELAELCSSARSLGLGGRPEDSGKLLGSAWHGRGAHHGLIGFDRGLVPREAVKPEE